MVLNLNPAKSAEAAVPFLRTAEKLRRCLFIFKNFLIELEIKPSKQANFQKTPCEQAINSHEAYKRPLNS